MQDTLSGQAGAQGSLQGLDARERVRTCVGWEICARGAGKSGRFDPFGRLDGQGNVIPAHQLAKTDMRIHRIRIPEESISVEILQPFDVRLTTSSSGTTILIPFPDPKTETQGNNEESDLYRTRLKGIRL